MSKLTRVTQTPFGTAGPTGDFGAFGSKAVNPSAPIFTQNPATIQSLSPFSEGWGQAIIGNYEPALEDMNGLFLLAFYQLGYILQMGLPEYDSGTAYYLYSKCQYGGVSYVSLQNNNQGNQPDINPNSWQCTSANIFGGNVASNSSMTLPNTGNSFKVTGTTTINNISIQQAGIIVTLIFNSNLQVNTGGNILLNQGIFNTQVNSTLTLISDGTNWFELSRDPSTPFSSQNVVSGSRSLNSIYQNTTGKTMFVSVTVAGGSTEVYFYTDSSSTPSTFIGATTAGNTTSTSAISFMVLPGNYYSSAIQNGSPGVFSWTEWY